MESGIERIGVANLGGATTKATHDRFRGVIVECDPANHDVLRRDCRRNSRVTILTHGTEWKKVRRRFSSGREKGIHTKDTKVKEGFSGGSRFEADGRDARRSIGRELEGTGGR